MVFPLVFCSAITSAQFIFSAFGIVLPPWIFFSEYRSVEKFYKVGLITAYIFTTLFFGRLVSSFFNMTLPGDNPLFKFEVRGHTKTAKENMMRLKVFEFIRRFLQHVLPTGFMKIRYFGFMHPSSRIPLKLAVTLREAFFSIYGAKKKNDKENKMIPRCSECNSNVRYLYFIPRKRLLSAGFT